MDNANEQDLIARAISGDEPALIRLLLAHYDRLASRIVAKLPADLRSTIDAEDVLQETFIQACRHIREFESRGDGAFPAWLMTIADRKVADRIKSHYAQKHGGGQIVVNRRHADESAAQLLDALADRGESPSRSAMRNELMHALQVAIASLPDDYRDAIRMQYFEAMSAAEIAQRMNRSEHAIHMLCSRGKAQLREILGQSSRYFCSRT